MIEMLRARPEIFAAIDVIQDETAYAKSPLARMPNVLLTPHIAGSMGRECQRMGDLAVEECVRYLRGEPPLVGLTRERAAQLA